MLPLMPKLIRADTEAITGRGDSDPSRSVPDGMSASESSEEPLLKRRLEVHLTDQEDTAILITAAGLLKLARDMNLRAPDQSLEKALELYYRIKREFPVTEERFIAETRIRYLNKHYFKVQ